MALDMFAGSGTGPRWECRRMDPSTSPLLTDLYQLNMVQAYLDNGMGETAVFEFFSRRLPKQRRFLMAAGLEQALSFLEAVRFGADELGWLAASGRFNRRFLDYVAAFRFSGDIDAMPEGSVFFANEPILRVTAPIAEAQLVETRLINLLHLQSLIAAKAARMVLAADGRALIDFGLRRAHGAEAGLHAARAAYIAGFAGTASVLAGPVFGVPLYGTMAHSYVQAHANESEAFLSFAQSRPKDLVLLIDTYDTEAGARRVVALAPRLAAEGIAIRGVRLDSGDLAAHARQVRAILDAGGLGAVRIFASGGIDERKIAGFVAGAAPIDGFGVGTSLVTSEDAPALDCAYKLQAYADRPRRKRSESKATWPGAKQVFRRYGADGRMAGDIVTAAADRQPGQPLLIPVMRGGLRLAEAPTLGEIRANAAAELAGLPDELRGLEDLEADATPYAVEIAPALRRLAKVADGELEDDGAAP
jgi:nicotinate phosphoribosyltransferase